MSQHLIHRLQVRPRCTSITPQSIRREACMRQLAAGPDLTTIGRAQAGTATGVRPAHRGVSIRPARAVGVISVRTHRRQRTKRAIGPPALPCIYSHNPLDCVGQTARLCPLSGRIQTWKWGSLVWPVGSHRRQDPLDTIASGSAVYQSDNLENYAMGGIVSDPDPIVKRRPDLALRPSGRRPAARQSPPETTL